MRRLSKKAGKFFFTAAAEKELEKKVRAAKGQPHFVNEVDGFVQLAYLLAEKKKSPAAGRALIDILERVLEIKKRASKTGWIK